MVERTLTLKKKTCVDIDASQKTTRSKNAVIATVAVAGISLLLTACGDGDSAADYPSQSIEYIIPYDPGGGADPAGREFSSMMADELNGSVDVINVPGGDESVGITQLATANADGHTLGLGTSGGFIAQPLINSDAQYSGDEDFTPLARMTATPYGLFVDPDSEYETLEDLIEAARENPGEIQVTSPVSMGNPALSLYTLEDQADVEFSLITTPGGTGEAALEVMGGRADAVIGNASGQLGLVEAGDLQPLAYSGSADYSEFLPDAESFEEAGYDIPFTSDYMTFAPADLPEDVEASLSEAAEAAVANEDWDAWATEQGALPDTLTGDELTTYLDDIQVSIEEGIELAESREG